MIRISEKDIITSLSYKGLVTHLRSVFADDRFTVPARQHLEITDKNVGLIMPAWNHKYYGLKQIIACPENPDSGLPIIQGRYDLFDVRNGKQLASIDAAALTAVRTAASSVLASSFFVREPKKLVILGKGVIGRQLQQAYEDFYSLDSIVMWSRSDTENIDLEKEIKKADIISCATHAYEPILHGKWLNGNPHIDLVGSYKKNMREADDDVIRKCEIYVDDWNALNESGDLFIPISKRIIGKSDIKGTLFDLCKHKETKSDRNMPSLFKSVGHAIEDLGAAIYFYESYF